MKNFLKQINKTFDINEINSKLKPIKCFKSKITDIPYRINHYCLKQNDSDQLFLNGLTKETQDLVKKIITFSKTNKLPQDRYIYLTLENKIISAGKTQRLPDWHIDGFQGEEVPKKESYFPETYGKDNCENLKEVKKILFCVTPSNSIDEYFIKNNYDLLICHHIGFSSVPNLTFHTALDFCKGGLTDYWNNILGIKNPQPIIKNAGMYGEINPIPFSELVLKLNQEVNGILGQTQSNKEIIKTVAVCSGYGAVIQKEVEKLNVDCYILGQTNKEFFETNLNGIIELGHTKSETIGYKCIQEMLKEFDSSITIDPTPLEIDVYGSEVFIPF